MGTHLHGEHPACCVEQLMRRQLYRPLPSRLPGFLGGDSVVMGQEGVVIERGFFSFSLWIEEKEMVDKILSLPRQPLPSLLLRCRKSIINTHLFELRLDVEFDLDDDADTDGVVASDGNSSSAAAIFSELARHRLRPSRPFHQFRSGDIDLVLLLKDLLHDRKPSLSLVDVLPDFSQLFSPLPSAKSSSSSFLQFNLEIEQQGELRRSFEVRRQPYRPDLAIEE